MTVVRWDTGAQMQSPSTGLIVCTCRRITIPVRVEVAAPGAAKDAKKSKAATQKQSAGATAQARDTTGAAAPPALPLSLLPLEVLVTAAENSPGDCASLVDIVLPAVAVVGCGTQAADPCLYEALQVRHCNGKT